MPIFLLYFLLFCLNIACKAEFELFNEDNINNSPRSVKIKLSFDSSQTIIGVSEEGYIKDKIQKIPLKPLIKYQIKINPNGNYDLRIIKQGQTLNLLASLEPPITLSSLFGDLPIYFDNKWYYGQINIIKSTTGIIAINILDLEKALWDILSPFIRINDSISAIKSAAIIARSSLYALTFTSKDTYHLTSENIAYQGLSAEKDYVIKLIKETEGEVLFNAKGELLYTPLRAVAINGALPFELIGQETKAWEKIIKIQEATKLLNMNGHQIGSINSFKQKVLVSAEDTPFEGGPFLLITGTLGNTQLSQNTTQNIFKLPSPYFRVYSFEGTDGLSYLQFIGSLPNNHNYKQEPVLNIVRLIYENNNSFEDYTKVLKYLYPESYLGRI